MYSADGEAVRWPWNRHKPHPRPAEIDAIVDRNVPIAEQFDEATRERHHLLTASLLRTKRWEPINGFSLDDRIRVTIAANAAIPILGLDEDIYRQVQSVIVRPTMTMSTGVRSGRVGGTYSDEDMPIIGQATPHAGPMAISWDAALSDSRRPWLGRNVIIHEFAHKIDMSDGYTDGTPPLRGAALTEWTRILGDEYGHTDARKSDQVLRPYAWTNPAEFFAVATETFFCTPAHLADAKPALYAALSGFYHQDPMTEWPRVAEVGREPT